MFKSLTLLGCCLLSLSLAAKEDCPYFQITVSDDQTGRGVPLVELTTVSGSQHVTDSNGVVAFLEPGLMDQKVFFMVRSHGYEYPADGFGMHGKALDVKPGGKAELKIKRVNIAERLYRITGEGIYRDSVLLGLPVPLKNPTLNAQVTGQDSVQLADYCGKLFWFYGDTNRVNYPLGHFGTSGATSQKPGQGGLDPSVGIDLTYFVNKEGFSRPMVPADSGLRWIDCLLTVKDDAGNERMICKCSHRKSLSESLGESLQIYNDDKNEFELLTKLAMDDVIVHAGSSAQTVRCTMNGQEYFGFASGYITVRVKADWNSVKDPKAYEAFTCLETGTQIKGKDTKIEHSADGKAVWSWKRETAPVGVGAQRELVKLGVLKPDEVRFNLVDAENGKPVYAHAGTVRYNAYLKKWIMLFTQMDGSSTLGEVYFAEADDPMGPWLHATKIITHNKYTFYNVNQHAEFDQDKYVYFEGTYTTTFSGNEHPTPRYEYNQMMYRLDLTDKRLHKQN